MKLFKNQYTRSEVFGKSSSGSQNIERTKESEAGFSLVEVVAAMVILLVAMLGTVVAFTFAINYNAGNNSRAQALAVLQQHVELIRAAKFTPTVTDSILTAGVKDTQTITSADNYVYLVAVTVDDDPFTSGVQVETNPKLKEITVTVTLNSPTPGWQTSVPATVVLRRVRAN